MNRIKTRVQGEKGYKEIIEEIERRVANVEIFAGHGFHEFALFKMSADGDCLVQKSI